ncbi:efflux RND transporter periplasmic adaptor subunit [Bacteroidota bacterium]
MKTIRNIFLIAVILMSCKSELKDEYADEGQASNSELKLSAIQIENAGIKYGKIESVMLSSDVNARGYIELIPNFEADIISYLEGSVTEILVSMSTKVKKNQVLARISSMEFIDMQKEFLMLKNNLGILKEEYMRQKALNKEKISSDKIYRIAETDYYNSLVLFEAINTKLELIGINVSSINPENIRSDFLIRSPIDGFVEMVKINTGQYVSNNESIFRVIDDSKIVLEILVFEKDIMKVKPGQRIDFTLSNLSTQYYFAKVAEVSAKADPDLKAVKVIAYYDNKDENLIPGMMISAKIHTDENMMQALPDEAIIFDGQNEYYIFYTTPSMHNDETTVFQKALLKRGYVEEGFSQVEMIDPLPDDAMIVISGGYYLNAEMMKGED